MSNRSNIPALPSTSVPVSAATAVAAPSSKRPERHRIPANPSAPCRSVPYISTRYSLARARGQWPHPSAQSALFPIKSSNQSAHSVRQQANPSASISYACAK